MARASKPGRLQRLAAVLGLRIARLPPAPQRDTEGWAVGDLAECVIEKPNWIYRNGCPFIDGPEKGWCRIVRNVDTEPRGMYLCFDRWLLTRFDAAAFRKITPPADAVERADAAFLADLKPLAVPPAPTPAAPAPVPAPADPQRIQP